VVLSLLHTIWRVHSSRFFRDRVVCPTPKLEDQGLHFVWTLPFDLSGMGDLPGVYAPVSILLQVTGAHKPPLHDNAVFLEEDI
jgi:hypothetical protein